ncbi:MAG: LysR family transcriptional regulator [Ruminococcus bromii]|nr:LysR family transcriptional regulator [Ruminococcus sp.]MBS5452983.1 LysR family transcriptional regulator [Ruminococcus sp.]
MDTNVLKTFVAVCEYSGFSAAAEKLGYTQSTVSSQIKQLESELNTVLFDRFYHRISLTSDGITVLQHAREILESHEKMLEDLRTPETIEGNIRLAMSSSVCNRFFKDDFLEFRKHFPNIHLVVVESGTEQMFDMLRKNEVDLIFTLDSHIYDSEFIICAEHEEKVHFFASVDNPLLNKENISLKELCAEDFVLTESNMSYRKLLNNELATQSLEIHPVLEIGNPLQICSLIKNSKMISFLPDFITEDYYNSGEIKHLPVNDCDVSVWTQLLIHKNKWKSPALNAFIDFYRDVIRK